MRHRKRGRKLGLKTGPRQALRRDVVCALLRHGRITTTLVRAKEFRPYAEKCITLGRSVAAAREAGEGPTALAGFRRLLSDLGDEAVVARLVDEIGPSFADRPGGYTRILRKAKGRLGDNALECIFELVTFDPEAAVEDAEV